jgi:hypothetical protein
VALFDPQAFVHLAPDAPQGRSTVKIGRTHVHLLPSLAELEPMLPHERLIALDVLKQLPL